MLNSLTNPENHTDERVRNRESVFDDMAIQNYLGGNLADFILKIYNFANRLDSDNE